MTYAVRYWVTGDRVDREVAFAAVTNAQFTTLVLTEEYATEHLKR